MSVYLKLMEISLSLFSGNGDIPINNTYTNRTTDTVATTGNSLSAAMKIYYSNYLIDLAEPLLVHDQFGQKHPIPKGRGKTIEFRKYDPLPKLTTPLTEGVTPNGQKLSLKKLTATVAQYGGYVELSDILMLTAIDDQLIQATKLLGSQAGRTLDTITREVLAGGTNVQYAEGQVSARASLVGGSATPSANHYLTVKAIQMAVRTLKRMNAPKINGNYVAIVHPDVVFDLMRDPEWQAPHNYVDTENIYSGEIGRIAGVRFVETTEAKIFEGAGASSRDVYATLVLGEDAYGVTELTGGGLQHIVKQLGSGGSTDPLDQRATAGWKATKVAERLVEPYMVRIETTSSYSAPATPATFDDGWSNSDPPAEETSGSDSDSGSDSGSNTTSNTTEGEPTGGG